MPDLATSNDYGVLSTPATVTIQRLLPGPIERVWAYLTESDLRRQWLAAGDMEMEVGSTFEFVWRNDELSSGASQRPAGFAQEQRMGGHITECDPLHRLSFAWVGSDDVTFQLETQGDKVLLTVIHRRLPDRDTLLKIAAGWHMHLDTLVARLSDREPAPFWPGWQRLAREYDARIPSSEALENGGVRH